MSGESPSDKAWKDWISGVIDGLTPKRKRIRISQPPYRVIAGESNTDRSAVAMMLAQSEAEYEESLDKWSQDLFNKVAPELHRIAEERGVDPSELIKLWDYLVDLKPPERRGKKTIPIEAELEFTRLRLEGKTLEEASGLAGISAPTARKVRNKLLKLATMINRSKENT